MKFGLNKHLHIFRTTNCTRPRGSCNFVVFEKFTRAYQHQISLEIMLLPVHDAFETSNHTGLSFSWLSCIIFSVRHPIHPLLPKLRWSWPIKIRIAWGTSLKTSGKTVNRLILQWHFSRWDLKTLPSLSSFEELYYSAQFSTQE